MIPTEVLQEIRKMPLDAQRQVHDELGDENTPPIPVTFAVYFLLLFVF